MNLTPEFRDRLNELIEKRKLTDTQCVMTLQTSWKVLYKARTYGIFPSIKCAIRIADFFDVSLDYLMGISDKDNYVKSDNPTTISARLQQLMPTMPFRKMLKTTKIGTYNFYDWKNGKRFPSKWEYVIAIARFYHVSLDYLFGRSDVR